jgi:hypothetical protein
MSTTFARLNVTLVTPEQVINNTEAAEYNPSIWKQRVLSYTEFKDVQFYQRDGTNKFLVEYTLPEGLTFLRTLEYHTSLSNGGFLQVNIIPCDKNFRSIVDAMNEVPFEPTKYTNDDTKRVVMISWFGSYDNKYMVQNSTKARKILADSRMTVTADTLF